MAKGAVRGTVVAYVSGHGFGHAAREVEILRHLPSDIRLIVKTRSAEWFWRAEMGRDFEYVADSFDLGCVQIDSMRIDIPATLAQYQQISAANRARLTTEAAFLRAVGATVVVSDIPPFPLVVAESIGLPAALVCNFTWSDIYSEFMEDEPAFGPLVEEMRAQYQAATVCLDTDLSLPMPYLPNREFVGLVARPGRRRRAELEAQLPPAARGRQVALIYLGNWGYPLDYAQLERFSGWQFVSYDPAPAPVANWTVLDRAVTWPHPDLTASVDLVISKPGYGLVGECLSVGTPLLYPPRPEFAEYWSLETALAAWPGGIRIDRDAFLALRWDDALAALPARATLPIHPAPGGPAAARRIASLL